MKRKDTYNVSVTVGTTDLGTFDKMSGGEVDSEDSTYRPGNLAEPLSLGGQRTYSNVTVSAILSETLHTAYFDLLTKVGKAPMTVTKQPLDADGNVFGRSVVYTGTLKRVQAPEVDSESGDAGLLELEMTVQGPVTGGA